MAVHLFRQFDAGRHQEGRPVNRVEADHVLADQVNVGGPEAAEKLGVLRISKAGDVIRQGIEPDIHDVIVASGDLHSPVEASSEIERSERPPSTKRTISLRRLSGRMKSGLAE